MSNKIKTHDRDGPGHGGESNGSNQHDGEDNPIAMGLGAGLGVL